MHLLIRTIAWDNRRFGFNPTRARSLCGVQEVSRIISWVDCLNDVQYLQYLHIAWIAIMNCTCNTTKTMTCIAIDTLLITQSRRAVRWAFWDVKGGFQNVREEEVIRELLKSEEGRRWIPWVKKFFRMRKFEVEWDGKVRGTGKTNLGAPQGSTLSLVIFLIWMAPIIRELEIEIRAAAGPWDNELPSYVDDLHLNICIWDRTHAGLDMDLILERADRAVHRVAAYHLPLEDSKHERLVLRTKRRGKKAEVKFVKWVSFVLDESLSFKEHWKERLDKAKRLLGSLIGLGNSNWGISANSWRAAYTGMIRAVALWGMELACRGQRSWEEDFEKLQYQALKKCVNATHGSERELVSQIAGVESTRMVLDVAQARLAGKNDKGPVNPGRPVDRSRGGRK